MAGKYLIKLSTCELQHQKPYFINVRRAKIQTSLRIRAVWSESSLGTFWIANDAKFVHKDNEDTGQTVRMRRVIWVFVGRSCLKVRFLTCWLI